MANKSIRPTELPVRTDPVASEVTVSDNGSIVAGVTWTDGVNAAVPVASQNEAEAGVDNSKRMTPLTTKKAIDAQVGPKISTAIGSLNLGSASQASVGDFATAAQGAKADTAVQSVNGKSGSAVALVKGDIGLGNVDNTSDLAKPISTATQTALNGKANSSVTVTAGSGLTGGGTLAANRTMALNSASIASLAKADTAVQPAGLTKAAVGLGNVDNTSDANKPVSTAQASALAGKFNNPTGTTAQYLRGDGSPAAFPAIPAGTVTSVGLSVPTGFTVSGSPVTSTGTLALGLASGYQAFTTAQSAKLAGIATAATANQTDAFLLARANHTGTQTIATVAGLQSALDGKATAAQGALADTAVQPAGLTKAAVGLGNVDNTSDLAKPISTATQTALNGKASTAAVTTTVNGLMIAADKVKLNGIAAGAQVNPGVATTSANGLMSAADKVKSDALAALAFKDSVAVSDIDATGVPSDSTYLRGDGSWAPAGGGGGGGGQVHTVGAGTGIAVNAADPVNPSVALNPASIASLAKADTALQAPGGTTGQVLAKSSNTTNDVGWVSIEAATAVSYAAQTLTEPQQAQARDNIGLGSVDNTSDEDKPISTATQTALNGKASTAAVTTTVNGLMIAADKVKLNGIETGAQVNTVTSVAGKTGAVTLAKGDVGLGNVDNTSDANKPVSTAQGAAINAKVTKASDTGLGGFTSAGHNLGNLSGTVTPVPTATSNFKYAGNNAAFTLAAPTTAGYYTIAILVTNAASGAGAMTATGFNKVHGTFAADANKKQVLTIEVFGSDKILTIRDAS